MMEMWPVSSPFDFQAEHRLIVPRLELQLSGAGTGVELAGGMPLVVEEVQVGRQVVVGAGIVAWAHMTMLQTMPDMWEEEGYIEEEMVGGMPGVEDDMMAVVCMELVVVGMGQAGVWGKPEAVAGMRAVVYIVARVWGN